MTSLEERLARQCAVLEQERDQAIRRVRELEMENNQIKNALQLNLRRNVGPAEIQRGAEARAIPLDVRFDFNPDDNVTSVHLRPAERDTAVENEPPRTKLVPVRGKDLLEID